MQSIAPITPDSPIPVPNIDSDEPVAVIPIASVAPLDGSSDGERINAFTVVPKNNEWVIEDSAANPFGDMRNRVLGKPLTFLAAAFSLGFIMARVLR